MVQKAVSRCYRSSKLEKLSWIFPLVLLVISTSKNSVKYVLRTIEYNILRSYGLRSRRNAPYGQKFPSRIRPSDNGPCVEHSYQLLWTTFYHHPLDSAQTEDSRPAGTKYSHSAISACCEHSFGVGCSECSGHDRRCYWSWTSSGLWECLCVHRCNDSGM